MCIRDRFLIHGGLDARCFLVVEGGDAFVDLPQVDAAWSWPKPRAGIVMGPLESVVEVHFEPFAESRLAFTRRNGLLLAVDERLLIR